MNKNCFVLIICVLTACGKAPAKKQPRWNAIVLRTLNQRIYISAPADTNACFFQTWSYRDSLGNYSMGGNPVIDSAGKFRLADAEKDSIFRWIDQLIANPDSIGKGCTDYVGTVTFQIDYGQYSRSCSYYSICEWQDFNSQTSKISQLLKLKMPLVND